MIGNPAEVILVRMCADGARPPAERANHPDSEARHQKGLVKVRKMAADLRDEGKVDPAFVYALERTDWCPRCVRTSLQESYQC